MDLSIRRDGSMHPRHRRDCPRADRARCACAAHRARCADRAWEGWIDLTPDALPVLDAPASVAGLVVAAGFSGHGFCLGPISGLLCADLALARAPRHDLTAFRLARFSDRSGTAARPALHG
jgi:glycine/D-amino acid oxidase-like deaminating enzyme